MTRPKKGEERSRSTIRVLTLTHHMGEGEAMQLEPLEVGLEERSRSTIRVLTLTHHMGEGEAMRL